MSGFKTGYAEKFELLLQLFPFPDREHAVKPEDRKWRNRELEQATEHRLSGPYLSQLRRGKIDDPGMRKLDLLGVVMGFPTELWVLEPEEWDEALLNNTRPGLRVEGLIGPSFPDVLKKKMRGRRHDSRSGALLDNEDPREVAARSKGRLTENAIRAMLDGSLRPNLTQLFALSEVLGVQLDEWLSVYDHAVEDEPEEPLGNLSASRSI